MMSLLCDCSFVTLCTLSHVSLFFNDMSLNQDLSIWITDEDEKAEQSTPHATTIVYNDQSQVVYVKTNGSLVDERRLYSFGVQRLGQVCRKGFISTTGKEYA